MWNQRRRDEEGEEKVDEGMTALDPNAHASHGGNGHFITEKAHVEPEEEDEDDLIQEV
jgi:hypothetical protein